VIDSGIDRNHSHFIRIMGAADDVIMPIIITTP